MPKREQILEVAFVVLVALFAVSVFSAVLDWIAGAPSPTPIVIESTFRASSTEHFKGFQLRAIEPIEGYAWVYEITHNWTPEEPWVTQRAVGQVQKGE